MRFLMSMLVFVLCGMITLEASTMRDVFEDEIAGFDEDPEIRFIERRHVHTAKCPKPFIPWRHHCYFFSVDKLNWFDALTVCQHVAKGHLIEIEDDKEMKFVKSYLQHLNATEQYWVGGTDFLDHSKFEWVKSKKPVLKNLWAPNEPNNVGGWERCMEVRVSGSTNDDACIQLQRFICEIDC